MNQMTTQKLNLKLMDKFNEYFLKNDFLKVKTFKNKQNGYYI